MSNPWSRWVPETDEEVEKKFKEMYDHQGIIACMIGIYTCRRKQGEEVKEAYGNTLKDYIKNTDSAHLVK